MGKICWIPRLAIQQHLPIQILSVFLRFKLPPNVIFQCYRPQTWQFYFFFLLFPFLVLNLRVVDHVTLSCKRPIDLKRRFNYSFVCLFVFYI